jgi:hypothetical protein
MQKIFFIIALMMATITSIGQRANDEAGNLSVTVVNEKQQSLEGVTIELFSVKDSLLLKAAITDSTGTCSL